MSPGEAAMMLANHTNAGLAVNATGLVILMLQQEGYSLDVAIKAANKAYPPGTEEVTRDTFTAWIERAVEYAQPQRAIESGL